MESLFLQNGARTANGAVTNQISGSAVLDLFSTIGALRGKPEVIHLALNALSESQDLTLRTLLWARDIRGGAGERQTFRTVLAYLAKSRPEVVGQILHKIPEVGRFDDLLVLEGTALEKQAFSIIRDALMNENGLCAKWMPRQDRKGAKALRNFVGLEPKDWRKLLVRLSKEANVLEQKMSANDWNSINLEHVPSQALRRSRSAIARNAPELVAEFERGLETGETKVNAGAVFPHDIVAKAIPLYSRNSYYTRYDTSSPLTATDIAMWAALPDYMKNVEGTVLPVVDVSDSMNSQVPGSTVTCKQVACALGLYLAERNEGVLKDRIVSFSGHPNFHRLQGSLQDRCKAIVDTGEDMSTNLLGVFQTILRTATYEGWTQDMLPSRVVIFSDMEFNRVGYNTNFQAVKARFQSAGYSMPVLVFWNLNARAGNQPATVHDKNAIMVSGFSSAGLKTALSAQVTSPYDAMVETLMDARYDYSRTA